MTQENQAVKSETRYTDIIPFGASEKDSIRLSLQIVQTMVAVKTKSGRTCSDIDAMKFIAMCKARRLNPFEGDAYLIGFDNREKPDQPNFSLITAHQAFLKRAELNAEFNGMKSGVIIKRDEQIMDLEGDFYLPGDELLGGWATVYFKTRQYPMHKRVRLQRFRKDFGIWKDDPAGMICKCAEADALRSAFPTMLGGLYLKEEMGATDDPKVTKPIFSEGPKASDPVIEVPPAEKTPPPPAPAPEPEKPRPAARPLKSKVEEPATHPQRTSPVAALVIEIKKRGVTEAQIMDFCKSLGVMEPLIKTLDQMEKEDSNTFELLNEQLDDICNRIKNPQGDEGHAE